MTSPHLLARRDANRGFSLVMVLVLLSALALGSAASMRGSANSLRVARATLMQTYANEQAQWALSYCQSQLLLPSAARDPKLSTPALTPADRPAWTSAALWRSEASVLTVLAAQMEGASRARSRHAAAGHRADWAGPAAPRSTQARGFSPDHRADPLSGLTVSGASVWLQRVVLIDGDQVRARTDKRILNPPLR
ncbi:MAG: hypothetical protein ACKOCZ_07275 [Betaproteobacteria bacterium]